MRRCQRLGCESSLDHVRADARYCSSTCRREAQRSRAICSDGTADPGFWSRYVRIRRTPVLSRGSLPFAALLAVLMLAGCGGGHKTAQRPTIATIKASIGHQCSPTDFAMQCKLPAQTLPAGVAGRIRSHYSARAAGAYGLYGVDFAWGGPRSCQAMRAIGARFAIGYLSYDSGKNLGPYLAATFRACGIPSVVGWETTADRAAQGYNAGVSDAYEARRQAAADGNVNRPIWFAIDFDASGGEVLSYFQGAHAVLGSRTEAYGGYYPLAYLHAHGVIGSQNFQTYAWSRGLWLPASIAPLEQYLNGNSYDNDRAIAADYGQFPYASPVPQPVVDPFRLLNKHPVVQRGVSKASEYATVKGWDAHHCRNTARHGTCGRLRKHMELLRSLIWQAAHSEPSGPVGFGHSGPSWGRFHRRERFAILTHRVH